MFMFAKPAALLAFLTLGSCSTTTLEKAVTPFEAAAAHAHAMAIRGAREPVVGLRCGGTKKITHGDGHQTECPGCVDCQAKGSEVERASRVELNHLVLGESIDAMLRPAHLVRVTRVEPAAEECADGACAAEVTILPAEEEACACTQASGSCSCSTATKRTAESCASGACARAGGPVRKLIQARPLQRARNFFRDRRPLRKLFGRAFCRGCG